MSRRITLVAVIVFVCLLFSCSQSGANKNNQSADSLYNNPIDAYFIPRIATSSSEAERRYLQDTYRGVWKAEYENVLVWLTSKCQYQEDIDKLTKYTDSVDEMIAVAKDIMINEWLDVYEIPPESPDRYSWGNGTRSALNQITGEIYRNAAMLLIENCVDYEYRDIDYSKEHYE